MLLLLYGSKERTILLQTTLSEHNNIVFIEIEIFV